MTMKGTEILNSWTNYQDERRRGGTWIISVSPPPSTKPPHTFILYMHTQQQHHKPSQVLAIIQFDICTCLCVSPNNLLNTLLELSVFFLLPIWQMASQQSASTAAEYLSPPFYPPQTDTIITSLCFATMQLLKPFRYKAALL